MYMFMYIVYTHFLIKIWHHVTLMTFNYIIRRAVFLNGRDNMPQSTGSQAKQKAGGLAAKRSTKVGKVSSLSF